jgi:hypothetical protein
VKHYKFHGPANLGFFFMAQHYHESNHCSAGSQV